MALERVSLSSIEILKVVLTTFEVYYWTTIRKNRDSYTPCPRISSETVTSILQDAARHVHQMTGVSKAVSQLIDIPSMHEFYKSLTPKKQERFRHHLRMYVDIYMPDCPFEVLSTNRYTKSMHEATVAARRFIRKGEVIKYLCGTRVRLTSEEKAELGDHFSIVEQTRNKATSLFLGPARFVDHDCAANAELMPVGRTSMEVRASRNILISEEIIVSYGDHYFDEGNHNCLCRTCEDAQRNRWQQDHDSSARSSDNTQNLQFDRHKACRTCHWLFPQASANLRTLGCPNCWRHTNLYGL
jgi:[histone H4]-N-methyl-L-lysine20 N-methyltransferase